MTRDPHHYDAVSIHSPEASLPQLTFQLPHHHGEKLVVTNPSDSGHMRAGQ